MRVVIAPDSFKGVLDAPSVARCIAEGVYRARPACRVVLAPMADGGEGTLQILLDAKAGQRRIVKAHGPLGEPVEVMLGLFDSASSALIELALVSGYALVPPARRNPLITSTYGLGEVLRATLDGGIDDLTLAVGGSATVDGGVGMMQALGMQFFDENGRQMTSRLGGGDLRRIACFRLPQGASTADDPRASSSPLGNVNITVACDVLNPACGPGGAAVVFGPQKGADAGAVKLLEEGLSHWADLLEATCGRRIRDEPGMGAAGGVALPLVALLDATLVPGVDLVAQSIGLADKISAADLVITGEGRLDRQSMMGKVVGAVGRMARGVEVPCVAIVGQAGPGAEESLSVLDKFWTLDGPLEETAERLTRVAACVAAEVL